MHTTYGISVTYAMQQCNALPRGILKGQPQGVFTSRAPLSTPWYSGCINGDSLSPYAPGDAHHQMEQLSKDLLLEVNTYSLSQQYRASLLLQACRVSLYSNRWSSSVTGIVYKGQHSKYNPMVITTSSLCQQYGVSVSPCTLTRSSAVTCSTIL